MRSGFGVCVWLPNGPMSAYPRSSQKMITTFGGRSAARVVDVANSTISMNAANTRFIGLFSEQVFRFDHFPGNLRKTNPPLLTFQLKAAVGSGFVEVEALHEDA